ncbi:MAG: hypothetical protein M0Z94_02000 [Dehalococcoidales bacterium]|nr:hypothetical protein [Dehalococcoidales bacterium]
MEKLLRVDMSTLSVTEEPLPQRYRRLGGRALTDKVVIDEVEPTCDPLGPGNKLVFATGIFAGHLGVSSSGRISVGTKSPLTGGIKEANGGGTLGHKLGRLGYRLVIVEGQAPDGKHYLLKIDKEGARLLPADRVWGLGCFATADSLRGEHGSRVSVTTIGPAGERGYMIAGIAVTDMEGGANRYCARGGVGAIMGGKGLKTLVVDDAGGSEPPIADPEAFRREAKRFNQALLEHPVTSESYPKYGTPALVAYVNGLGALPTNNFRRGDFARSEAISGERLRDLILERGGEGRTTHSCMPGCIIRSSNVFADREGRAYCSPIEYETMGLCGSNLGLGDLDYIAEINRWCNDFGADTIEVGAALGLAMDAGLAKFGDMNGVRRLLEEISCGTMLGRVLAQGAVATGRVLGLTRVPAILGQAVPAYDPRVIKGNGVTFITSPQGADHTAGNSVRMKIPHTDPAGQEEVSRSAQISAAAIDALGICLFAIAPVGANPDIIPALVSALLGEEVPSDYWTQLGTEVMRDEIAFNKAAGVPPVHARMPEYFRTEPVAPHNTVFDVSLAEIEEVVRF